MSDGIDLDRDELGSLLSMLSASGVYGVEGVTPVPSKFRDGVEKLRARALIGGQPPNQAVPNPELLRLMTVVAFPQLVVISERGGAVALHFVDGSQCASLEGGAAQGFKLGAVADTNLLARRVLRFVGVDPASSSSGAAFLAPQAAVDRARTLAAEDDVGAATTQLKSAGLGDARAAEVAAGLAASQGARIVVVCPAKDAGRRAWVLPPVVKGAGWLVHKPAEKDAAVQFEPLSATSLEALLASFFASLTQR